MSLRTLLGLAGRRRPGGDVPASNATRDRRRRAARMRLPSVEAMEDRQLLTIAFQFDYTLDRNNFFASSDRRAALEYAGHLLGDRLFDSLSAIAPSGSNTWKAIVTNPASGVDTTLTNPSLPSNVIRVYAGGRDLAGGTLGIGGSGGYSSFGSSSWNTLVKTRGQTGAANGNDVSPRIGNITFDTVGTNWFFGRTSSGRSGSQSDFLSVAVHELGHVLGINSGNLSWTRFISGGVFNGPAVKAANNGRAVGVAPGNGHFAEGVKTDGLEVSMDPTITTGTRKFFGKIDFAALTDIGWNVGTVNDTIYQASDQLIFIPNPVLGTSSAVSFAGSIASAHDVDFYRVYVGAGGSLSASVRPKTGGTSVDTYLRIYDTTGGSLAFNDSGGTGGTDSIKNYRVPRSDYYIVAVSSYTNRNYSPFVANTGSGTTTGDYTIAISAF